MGQRLSDKVAILESFLRILDVRFGCAAPCVVAPQYFSAMDRDGALGECRRILTIFVEFRAFYHIFGGRHEVEAYDRAVFRSMTDYILCSECGELIRSGSEKMLDGAWFR